MNDARHPLKILADIDLGIAARLLDLLDVLALVPTTLHIEQQAENAMEIRVWLPGPDHPPAALLAKLRRIPGVRSVTA